MGVWYIQLFLCVSWRTEGKLTASRFWVLVRVASGDLVATALRQYRSACILCVDVGTHHLLLVVDDFCAECSFIRVAGIKLTLIGCVHTYAL